MGVNSVGGYSAAQSYYSTQKADSKGAVEEMAEELDEAKAAAQKTQSKRQDGFVRSTGQDIDTDKIRSMKANLHKNMDAFQRMVTNTTVDQAGALQKKFKEIFKNGDDSVKLIGDDPQWGIEATANRLVDFAKALSGDDPSKADALIDAVEKGFKQAEKILGGLPEVSKKTLERTRELFAEWKDGKNVNKAAEE